MSYFIQVYTILLGIAQLNLQKNLLGSWAHFPFVRLFKRMFREKGSGTIVFDVYILNTNFFPTRLPGIQRRGGERFQSFNALFLENM